MKLHFTMRNAIRTLVFAFRYLIGPHTDSRLTVVSEPRTALILGCLSVPTVPEHVAFLFVRENTVQTRTMRRADRRLELRPIPAIHVVQIIAILGEELAIARVEREPIAASLQLRHVVVAFPIFVAGYVMGIEAEVVRAFERFLGGCACA